ncbi:MAG TPA: GntR family transcriptional regulator, partial [Blastocatellia bacterium]|nr:GntR family transcriptional regulator [Blastocatellia bacterium]
MILELDRQSHAPLYAQIAAEVRRLIRQGTLKIGDRLPPNRVLAVSLGVNRSTVATAYDELLADGLIASRVGSGTYIAAAPVVQTSATAAEPVAPPLPPLNWEALLPELRGEEWLAAREAARSKGNLLFTHALPAAELFPLDAFRRSVERVLRREGRSLLQLGAGSGYETLQQYLLQQMALASIRAEADEILLTSGCQQALDLLRQTLLQPGDEVV